MVSRASFRLSDLEKNRSKVQKKRKRKSENWIYVYCDRALEKDEDNGEKTGHIQMSPYFDRIYPFL